MFSSYLKMAVRSLLKRRGYAVLNIAGLAAGFTCCLLIFRYVAYEKSFDRFEPAAEKIFRVRLDSYQKGKLAFKSATSYPAIGPAMQRDFPQVEQYCRLIDDELLLSNDELNRKFSEKKGYYADPSVTTMFGLHFRQGNPLTALNGPGRIILSRSTARRYFGDGEAMGKTLVDRSGAKLKSFQVSGVYDDVPNTSHLLLDYLVSYSTLGRELSESGDTTHSSETSWGWYDFYVYVQLRQKQDLAKVEAGLPAFSEKYMNSVGFYKANNYRNELHLVPLTDIHLYSNVNQEAEVNGNGQTVSFLFLVAFLIITIAWVNYINLATARSVERAREVGVRKVMGAARSSLVRQFLLESVALNFVALCVSLILAFILGGPFDSLTRIDPHEHILLPVVYWGLFAGVFAGGSLLAGLYPALVLSGFQPVIVIKAAFKSSAGGMFLRQGLIVGQFIASVVLIAGTMIVYKQLRFMQTQDNGVDITQTLVLKSPQTVSDSLYQNFYQPFKSEVLKLAAVKSITASTAVMGEEIYWTNASKRLGADQTGVTLYNLGIDYDFIPSYGIKVVAGRSFSEKFGGDAPETRANGLHHKAVMLNETAARLLGFSSAADAAGQRMAYRRDTVSIVGVTADFHQLGLQKAVDPVVMVLRPSAARDYSLKISASNAGATIAAVKTVWEKHFPKDPFDYFFLDESFAGQYRSEALFGKVFSIFSMLAMLIASFGLFGLSAYNVTQRTKEIGIRKVLGASARNIWLLLSRDFLRLVVLSLLLAIPIGWVIMYKWLQDFAYRTSISWWTFALAGAIALFVAIATISFQIFKATVRNPADTLKVD